MKTIHWTESSKRLQKLPSPGEIIANSPCEAHVSGFVENSRRAIANVLDGHSDKLVVIVGPCSIHDLRAALDYAEVLARAREQFNDELEIVMRVYLEKPRTTLGWKGLISDPLLDGSHRKEHGLHVARTLLRDVNSIGLPCSTEFLDPFTPAYLADLISWGAIGARTTESQVHREIASGLPMPVGFKNGTDGNLQIAVDAIKTAAQAHYYTSIDEQGNVCMAVSSGNQYGHLVLRGGRQPNFDAASVSDAEALLDGAALRRSVFIDVSHANCSRQYQNQILVCENIAAQIMQGAMIAGVMIESNLQEGRQNLIAGTPLEYGKSITDPCISWSSTLEVLESLAQSVRLRRRSVTVKATKPETPYKYA